MNNFSTGIEHLLAELKVIDLLLQRQVMRLRAANLLTEDEMRGLYISDAQVDALLSHRDHNWFHMPGRENESKGIQGQTAAIEHLRQENADRVHASHDLPLPQLEVLFGLTPFESQVLLIGVAPEVDMRYETLYAYVQNDVTKKHPSVDLVLKLLCQTVEERIAYRAVFTDDAPFLRHRLIRLFDDAQDRETVQHARYIKVDQRIIDFLTGNKIMDQRLAGFTRRVEVAASLDALMVAEEQRTRLQQIVQFLKQKSAILFLHGPYGVGKQATAEAICATFKRALLVADLRQIVHSEQDIATILTLLRREALLQNAGLYLAHFEVVLGDDEATTKRRRALIYELDQPGFPIFLGSEQPWYPIGVWSRVRFIDIELPLPDFAQRLQLWKQALQKHGQQELKDEDVTMLANQFVLSGRQIDEAVREANVQVTLRAPEQGKLAREDLSRTARAQSNQNLRQLAQKVDMFYTWKDIVLPPRALQQLHEVCASIEYRHIVFEQWGFERKLALGKGLNVLFSGPSGTGKTMAAGIVAHELERDLYKIDLSNVVSKYIGETEKNLSRIFREAQASNAILFFDEADALFGKRSEVKDAHDRYANIEVAYLLQQMEEYRGIVILATNLSKNIDDAFARRMQHSIEFPLPDVVSRERIWRGMFPESAPLAKDIDLGFLARQFELAGGNIRNIALAGALLAAEEGNGVIRMEHLIIAVARELQKLGKMPSQTNFRNYYELIHQKA